MSEKPVATDLEKVVAAPTPNISVVFEANPLRLPDPHVCTGYCAPDSGSPDIQPVESGFTPIFDRSAGSIEA